MSVVSSSQPRSRLSDAMIDSFIYPSHIRQSFIRYERQRCTLKRGYLTTQRLHRLCMQSSLSITLFSQSICITFLLTYLIFQFFHLCIGGFDDFVGLVQLGRQLKFFLTRSESVSLSPVERRIGPQQLQHGRHVSPFCADVPRRHVGKTTVLYITCSSCRLKQRSASILYLCI